MNWVKQHPYWSALVISLAIHVSALSFFGNDLSDKPKESGFQIRIEDIDFSHLPANKIEDDASESNASRSEEGSGASKTSKPVSANQLLGDPQTGKVFSKYFKDIKSSIANASSVYSDKSDLKGEITVYFVLTSAGKVYDVNVLNKDTANDALIRTAIRIIRDAEADFDPLPSEIRHDRVVFQVTLEFN